MLARIFFKFFPTPLFLDMPYAGLHISDDAVRVIQFSQSRHGLEVVKFATKPLSPGVIDAGYIKDEKALVKIVSEIASELGISFVRASIPEEKMYLFKIDVPNADEKTIRQSIEFKLEENVPLSPGDALFNFDILSKQPTVSRVVAPVDVAAGVPGTASGAAPVGTYPAPVSYSSKHTAMVSVAPRKVIDAYLSVLTQAKLTALSFEVEARSLARAFVPKANPDTELVINIMNQKTGIYVICEGVISFTSTVMWGGATVTDAIAKAFSVSAAEALAMKKTAGYHDGADTKKVLAAVQETVGAIQKEIAKVYSYWIEHGEGCKDISRIILCGADAQLVGLLSHISPDPKIPVEVGNVWTNAFSSDRYIPPISRDESLDYAVAAGLALPQ